VSLSLSGQKAGQKQKRQILSVSAQLMALGSALRSLSSVAVYHPFLMPLCQGDISTLQNRGHLYFALTGENVGFGGRSLFQSKRFFAAIFETCCIGAEQASYFPGPLSFMASIMILAASSRNLIFYDCLVMLTSLTMA